MGRKQDNIIEMRLAMNATAEQFKQELENIKWSLISLDKNRGGK